jgi:hypothetical protein
MHQSHNTATTTSDARDAERPAPTWCSYCSRGVGAEQSVGARDARHIQRGRGRRRRLNQRHGQSTATRPCGIQAHRTSGEAGAAHANIAGVAAGVAAATRPSLQLDASGRTADQSADKAFGALSAVSARIPLSTTDAEPRGSRARTNARGCTHADTVAPQPVHRTTR